MIGTIIRLLRGEQIFFQTVVPNRYTIGSVRVARVGGGRKALMRVTAVKKSSEGMYSVWGTTVDPKENNLNKNIY